MSAVDPNLAPVLVVGAGGGASLPTDDPSALLEDPASPDRFFVTNVAGNGALATAAEALALLGLPVPVTGQVTLTAWTAGSATGGAAVSQQTGPSRMRFTVPSSAAGAQSVSRTDLIPDPNGWDVSARVQVIVGDGSASTRARLSVGTDASNCAVVEVDTAGAVIAYRVTSGSSAQVTTLSGVVTSGQLTGGQLWLRLCGSLSGFRAFWGVGSAGALPTSWSVVQSRGSDDAAAVSVGAYASVLVGTIDSSVAAGLTVDVLDVQASGLT